MRHIDRCLLAGTLGLALLVAACGGSSAPAASPTTVASPTPAASAAPAASEPGATESAGAVRSEAPDEPTAPAVNPPAGGATDLEVLLPSQVGGVQLQKVSFAGDAPAVLAALP